MPFLPPNQQRQSTEAKSTQNIAASYIRATKVTEIVNKLVNTGVYTQELIYVSVFLKQNIIYLNHLLPSRVILTDGAMTAAASQLSTKLLFSQL